MIVIILIILWTHCYQSSQISKNNNNDNDDKNLNTFDNCVLAT